MAKRVPPTRFPDAAAVSYFRAVRGMILELGAETLSLFDQQIKPQIHIYRQDSREYVTDGPLDAIRRAIEWLKTKATNIFTAYKVQKAANDFVNNVNTLNKVNILQQGKVVGIDPTQYEPWLEEFMRVSVAENVGYISTIRDEYFPKIESVIYQGVKNGESIRDIRQQLVDRIGMSVKRAQFIAVDQAGSILGQMTAKRHQNMGVKKFRWLTSQDERVRPSHRALSDKVFSYSNPPAVGLPGTDYRCRCVAIPLFED